MPLSDRHDRVQWRRGENRETRDRDLRTALVNLLAPQLAKTGARLVHEMGVRRGSCRADVVVIQDGLHAYELKSDVDSLRRLPKQVRILSSVCDQITLVTTRRHVRSALKMVPEWFGVMLAAPTEREIALNLYREGARNPSPDPVAVAKLLWRSELLLILERKGAATGVRSKSRAVLCSRIAGALSQQHLVDEVCRSMIMRKGWLTGEQPA